MNRRISSTALAAGVVGGVAALLAPQHAASIARVMATAVVVVIGGLLLGAVAPFVSRDVPRTGLDLLPRTGAPPLDPHGLRDARRDLARPYARGSLPVAVWERLVVFARMELQYLGHDLDAPASNDAVAPRLVADSRRLLATVPRPGDHRDPSATAALVHRTLDNLNALEATIGDRHGHH